MVDFYIDVDEPNDDENTELAMNTVEQIQYDIREQINAFADTVMHADGFSWTDEGPIVSRTDQD